VGATGEDELHTPSRHVEMPTRGKPSDDSSIPKYRRGCMTMALARRGCGADAVVRLEVSADLIAPRLSIDPTEERREDNLRMTREWLSARHGTARLRLGRPGPSR
jgi:hypothetical protein